jgi:hypothetical protein
MKWTFLNPLFSFAEDSPTSSAPTSAVMPNRNSATCTTGILPVNDTSRERKQK